MTNSLQRLLASILPLLFFTVSYAKQGSDIVRCDSTGVASDSSFIDGINSDSLSVLNVVFLGDSNTWLGGDDCNRLKGWNTWFCKAFRPRSARSYARSGATWTNTPRTKLNTLENIGRLGDNNVIYNQVERLRVAVKNGSQPKPDIILVLAGTNDCWYAKHRPNAFDRGPEQAPADSAINMGDVIGEGYSLGGAVLVNCAMLRTYNPEARIVLLTPFETTKASPSLIARAGDIIEAYARQMNLDCIRLDKESGISSKKEKVQRTFTYDGTHTNEAGARRVGEYVAKRLREIIMQTR